MYITILASGSRTEVQSFVSLGSRLAGSGHSVRIATHGEHRRLVLDRGLEFAPLPAAIASHAGPVLEQPAGQLAYEACRGADLLITARGMRRVAEPLAERLEVPLVYGPQRLVLRRRPSYPWQEAVAV